MHAMMAIKMKASCFIALQCIGDITSQMIVSNWFTFDWVFSFFCTFDLLLDLMRLSVIYRVIKPGDL